MKRLVWLILVLLSPTALTAQGKLPQTIAVSNNVSMRVWVPSGTVRIETWDRDSILVTGTIAKGAHFFGGGAGRGAKVGIEPDNPDDTKLSKAELVVTVPRNAHVWVKMTDGNVIATGTRGELEVITVTGSIAVNDAQGVVAIETIDASVALDRVKGAVRVTSGSGRVTLSQIAATLTVKSVSGAIELGGEALQDAELATIGGGITVRGTVAPKALIDVGTHSGVIMLLLPPAGAPLLTLSSRGGTVTNTLPVSKVGIGQIIAHSFKGDINVMAVGGILKGKANSPP